MKKTALILFVILMYSHTYAQVNLVPNPSFEIYSSCPTSVNQIARAYPWYTPTYSTDYYNVCGTDSTGVANPAVPTNIAGYQMPRTGNGYAGIGFNNSAREYLSIKLDSALQTGKKYTLEFYLSLSNYSIYSTSTIGAYFSTTDLTEYSSLLLLPLSPQIENSATRFLSDTTNWMLVKGEYIATGNEQYLTIGSFSIDSSNLITDTINPSSWFDYAYYYVDDVSLTTYVEAPEEPQEALFVPTLLSGQQFLEITGLQPNTQLIVFNTLGQVIYRNSNYANDMSVITLATGVYYYSLKTSEGEARKGTILIVN